jgi:general secretion pathway protein F
MPQFHYKAVTPAGEIVEGRMDAPTVEDVVARLQEQGNVPLAADDADAGGGSLFKRWQRQPLSGAALVQFTQQLGTLLGAGLPLDRSLQLLLELPEGERARNVVMRVRERVRGGASLSRALEEEHGAFSRLYVSMVRAGEAGGALDETLKRLADYLERARSLRESVIGALVYPAFLLFGVLGSLVLLLAFVVPQFVPIFADMQVPVPWITAAVLALGNALKAWWWLLVLLLGGGAYYWHVRLRDPAARLAWHAWLLRRRGLGPLLLKIETARIAHTLGTLLKNGVPLLAAINVARKVTANRALDQALAAAHDQVKDGAGLAFALGQGKLFPRLAVHMVQVGEEAGQLDAMLLKVADTYELESRRAIDRLLAALVPALTILMTVLVAIVMAAILLPLLSLTSGIQ